MHGAGIEVVSDPFAELGVALVLGVGDGREEFGVTPGAADIFGRAIAKDGAVMITVRLVALALGLAVSDVNQLCPSTRAIN